MTQVSGTGRSRRLRSPSSRRAAFAFGLLFALVGGLLAAVSTTAGADTEADISPISGSDLSIYPNVSPSIFPDGCTANGANILTGVSYSLVHDGNTTTSTDLRNFSLVIGDTVTMTWQGYAQNCAGVGISLAVKATQHPVFVPNDDQHLVDFQYCSGADCGSEAAFGHLSLTIPDRVAACNFQLDAVIGPPLSSVGPNGSYYGNQLRVDNGKASGPDMLISANNGGEGKCIIPPTATAVFTCSTSGVDVAVHNPDDDDVAHVNILKNGVVVEGLDNVAVGTLSTVHEAVPFTNGETATVSVVDVLTNETVFTQDFTANCLDVSATMSQSCSSGGVDIHLANTKEGTAHFTVTVGDSTSHVDLVSGTKDVHVDVPEDSTVSVTVSEQFGGTLIDSQSVTMDCQQPTVGIVHDCGTGGATFTFSNTGESPSMVTVTKNGEVIDTVTVPGQSTSTKTYAMNEDETAMFRATGTGLDTGDQSVTFDCVEAQQETTSSTTAPPAVQGEELARTGAASTVGLTTAAGLLLMLGGFFLAIANRPLPMATVDATRSRGR